MESQHSHRKDEHLSLAEKFYKETHASNQFAEVRLIHNSLPELGIDDVSLTTVAGELTLPAPFYIEAMTGGSEKSKTVNDQLAAIAANLHLAVASGSQSIALRDPHVVDSFEILRKNNPNGIVFANLSANATVDQASVAIKMLQADAIEIHVNAVQEMVMPEGERKFNWLDNIQRLVAHLSVPVIVKEVGFGMSNETIQSLNQVGVQYVNISGRGGTNFAMIENRRNHDNDFTDLMNWGQTTVESLLEAQEFNRKMTIIASGGITAPIEIVKAGVLGASAVGVAGQILHILIHDGPDQLERSLAGWLEEIKRLLVLTGSRDFKDLRNVNHIFSNQLLNYISQRKL